MINYTNKLIPIIILSLLLSLLFFHFLGDYNLAFEGLEFTVETSLHFRGITEVEIPPLGLVRAHTHRTPVKLTVRLDNINLEQIRNILEDSPDQTELSKRLELQLRREAIQFFAQILFLAFIAGALAALLMRTKDPKHYTKSILASVAIVSILIIATYKDYDTNQFQNPEYEGVLKAAPWMIGIAEEAIAKIDTLGHKLQLIADNFSKLYQQIDELQPLQTAHGNIRVLHVSDIHNNPAALQFVGRMSELFAVDFIIDTGDISDFGTPLEGLLLERIKDLPVPYVFVAGNHDSPDIINKLKEFKGKVMVANKSVVVNGLHIAGFHDPSSSTSRVISPTTDAVSRHVVDIQKQIREVSLHKPIDIIAVHSPYVAQPLAGLAPVFVFGHNHQFGVSTLKGSVMVNAGTTGASGLGTLQEIERRPYSVMLLHFYVDSDETRLLAVDSIIVDSITAEFSMQRHLFGTISEKREASEIVPPVAR